LYTVQFKDILGKHFNFADYVKTDLLKCYNSKNTNSNNYIIIKLKSYYFT